MYAGFSRGCGRVKPLCQRSKPSTLSLEATFRATLKPYHLVNFVPTNVQAFGAAAVVSGAEARPGEEVSGGHR